MVLGNTIAIDDQCKTYLIVICALYIQWHIILMYLPTVKYYGFHELFIDSHWLAYKLLSSGVCEECAYVRMCSHVCIWVRCSVIRLWFIFLDKVWLIQDRLLICALYINRKIIMCKWYALYDWTVNIFKCKRHHSIVGARSCSSNQAACAQNCPVTSFAMSQDTCPDFAFLCSDAVHLYEVHNQGRDALISSGPYANEAHSYFYANH